MSQLDEDGPASRAYDRGRGHLANIAVLLNVSVGSLYREDDVPPALQPNSINDRNELMTLCLGLDAAGREALLDLARRLSKGVERR